MVVWIIPFYLSLSIGFFLPSFFGYIFALGLTLTVGGLFVQVFVYQYIARGFNLLKLTMTYKPITQDGHSQRYWKWPDSQLQLWYKDIPKEERYGRYNSCWLKLEKPIRHPSYNGNVKIWAVKFIYEGHWNDLILGMPGQGVYSASIVDIPHCDKLTVSEMVGEVTTIKKGQTPIMNHIPPLISYNGYSAWAPVFFIQFATGTIDLILKEKKELYQIAGYATR